MPLYGVVADDLTGACDVGVQFRKAGMRTLVTVSVEALRRLRGDVEVVVVDAESRRCSPEEAYRKVREAFKALKDAGARPIYKKMDSTLRGNVGSEIEATVSETEVKAVIVAPAFPENRRVTVGGLQLIGDRPVHKTEFAEDPASPVRESDITKLVRKQSRLKVSTITLETVRLGVKKLKDALENMMSEGYKIIVVDAETREDLKTIAEAMVDMDVLPCGSAGLAKEVSHLLRRREAEPRLVLVFSGSLKDVTHAQIRRAEEALKVRVLAPDLKGVLRGDEAFRSGAARLVSEAEEALKEGRDVIVTLTRSRSEASEAWKDSRAFGMDDLQIAERALGFLSEVSRLIVEDGPTLSGLVLVGGDTAINILEALGAGGVVLEGEVLPGIPFGRLVGGKLDGLRVVTKAGGFGDQDALVEAINHLKFECI